MFLFFFFFKQKTAYEMRISDRSSDVCSSDLLALNVVDAQRLGRPAGDREIGVAADPFELEGRAQPVVAADVITAHESAVGGDAPRIGQAPARVELELARADRKSTRLNSSH